MVGNGAIQNLCFVFRKSQVRGDYQRWYQRCLKACHVWLVMPFFSLPFQQVSVNRPSPKTLGNRLNDLAARTGDRQQIRGAFVKKNICVARDRRPEGTIHSVGTLQNLKEFWKIRCLNLAGTRCRCLAEIL